MFTTHNKHAFLAAYHCFRVLTSQQALTPNFDKEVGALALNPLYGTPQHKRMILGSIVRTNISVESVYGLLDRGSQITTVEPLGPSSNVISEVVPAKHFLDNFGLDITNLYVTSDTINTKEFWTKNQSHHDFVATIKPIPRTIGQYFDNYTGIRRLHDCKDGSETFESTTKGNLGYVMFDHKGFMIQTTEKFMEENKLKVFNERRLKSLTEYFTKVPNNEDFMYHLNTCQFILNHHTSIFDANREIERILWNEIQRHPRFDRSISFIFTEQVDFRNAFQDEGFQSFFYNVQKRLPEKPGGQAYNLQRISDRKVVYTHLLKAYQESVDRHLPGKLQAFRDYHGDSCFDKHFSDVFAAFKKYL